MSHTAAARPGTLQEPSSMHPADAGRCCGCNQPVPHSSWILPPLDISTQAFIIHRLHTRMQQLLDKDISWPRERETNTGNVPQLLVFTHVYSFVLLRYTYHLITN